MSLLQDAPTVADLLKTLNVECSLWVDGTWQSGGEQLPILNPANGETVAEVAMADRARLQNAIDGAAGAFESWRSTSALQRGAILKQIAASLLSNSRTLATLLVLEQGKPLAQAIGEVEYAASFFEWFGEQARRLSGSRMSHADDDREFHIDQVPAGVAGLVTPWNFPLAQGAKKAAAALAAGCTAVWKPSELTPLIALAMGPLTQACGLPDGVLQIVPALGPMAGEAFANDHRIAVVSATGSTRTGQAVYAAGAQYLQRITLELGGNAPFIVLDDADLDVAAEHLVKLKLLCSGQVCVTANRVFVPESLLDSFSDNVASRLMRAKIGDGLSDKTDAGPLIHREACDRVTGFVDAALKAGAQVVCENRSYESETSANGSFHPALVLRDVPEDSSLCCEEVFGPVISLMSYQSIPEVVSRANATCYGLAAYVYGRDVSRMHAIASSLDVGIVGVNDWRPLKAEIPFGGIKMSGLGAEGGEEGLREFLEPRVISLPKPTYPSLSE